MPDWREHIRQALTELVIDPAREEEVVAELVQHLDDRYRACQVAGGSDDEARRAALDELADARLLVAELMHAKKRQPPLVAIQDSRGGMLSGLWRDLRHGFRMIRRHPGFSSVAVLTLALGIAANGAVFSVIHAVLLQELPYTRPGELVMVWESRPREGIDDNVVSPADFLDWRARQRVFASMAAAVPTTLTLSGSGEPEQLSASGVSAAFFSVLGVVPILGRDFTVEEEQAGRHRVVMLTHGLWQRRFAGTPDIVGTRITLSGEPYEVIGVLPASFRYGEQTVSVFSPIDFSTEDMRARFNHFLRVLARLKPGTTVAQAQENMDAISAQIQSEVELQNQGHGARVIALREQLVGDVRSSLLILMAAVAFVLLIACVNIAISSWRAEPRGPEKWRCVPRWVPGASSLPGRSSWSPWRSPRAARYWPSRRRVEHRHAAVVRPCRHSTLERRRTQCPRHRLHGRGCPDHRPVLRLAPALRSRGSTRTTPQGRRSERRSFAPEFDERSS